VYVIVAQVMDSVQVAYLVERRTRRLWEEMIQGNISRNDSSAKVAEYLRAA
jgi:hypothetical protein